NYFFERHAEVEKLRHDIDHVLHPSDHTAGVKVCANRIGPEPLLSGRYCLAIPEAATAVADIEDNASLLSLKKVSINFTGFVDHGNPIQVGMRINITWSQVFE